MVGKYGGGYVDMDFGYESSLVDGVLVGVIGLDWIGNVVGLCGFFLMMMMVVVVVGHQYDDQDPLLWVADSKDTQ